MRHTCHAHGCTKAVPPKMFMCLTHWRSLPVKYQRAIWREYRRGQEDDKRASKAYLAVQQLSIGVVAFKPLDEKAAALSARYFIVGATFRQEAIDAGGDDPWRGLLTDEQLAELPPSTMAVDDGGAEP